MFTIYFQRLLYIFASLLEKAPWSVLSLLFRTQVLASVTGVRGVNQWRGNFKVTILEMQANGRMFAMVKVVQIFVPRVVKLTRIGSIIL